jgi:hypothetical protein
VFCHDSLLSSDRPRHHPRPMCDQTPTKSTADTLCIDVQPPRDVGTAAAAALCARGHPGRARGPWRGCGDVWQRDQHAQGGGRSVAGRCQAVLRVCFILRHSVCINFILFNYTDAFRKRRMSRLGSLQATTVFPGIVVFFFFAPFLFLFFSCFPTPLGLIDIMQHSHHARYIHKHAVSHINHKITRNLNHRPTTIQKSKMYIFTR